MKLGLLSLFGLLVIGGIVFHNAKDREPEGRRLAIVEHRTTLGMTMEAVRESLGTPVAKDVDRAGSESWTYADRKVQFSKGGRVINVLRLSKISQGAASTLAPREGG
jgi:hypothetical protein